MRNIAYRSVFLDRHILKKKLKFSIKIVVKLGIYSRNNDCRTNAKEVSELEGCNFLFFFICKCQNINCYCRQSFHIKEPRSLSPIISGPNHPYVQLPLAKSPLKSESNSHWTQHPYVQLSPDKAPLKVWPQLSLGPIISTLNYPLPKHHWILSPIVSGSNHP